MHIPTLGVGEGKAKKFHLTFTLPSLKVIIRLAGIIDLICLPKLASQSGERSWQFGSELLGQTWKQLKSGAH
jgi:hypothetical protein